VTPKVFLGETAREIFCKEFAGKAGRLSDMERRVLVERFGEDGRSSGVMKIIAESLGVSPSRVQQIETQALRKLGLLRKGSVLMPIVRTLL
jgi:DNA-directed RNA polymerase sigma subunit (sigma70/sigma32)